MTPASAQRSVVSTRRVGKITIGRLFMKQPILITVAAVLLIAYDLTADVPEWIRELWLAAAITVPVFVWAMWWMGRRSGY